MNAPMKLLLLILVAGCLSMPLRAEETAEPEHFMVEQLEGMADRGEWNELVLNLEGVIPTQRNARWETLVERASLGYLKTLQGQGNAADKISDSLLNRFPFLGRSAPFSRARLDAKLGSLDLCYQRPKDDPTCGPRLLDFARENRKESVWVRQAAELVARRQNAVAAMPYFRLWLENDRRGAVVCEEAVVRHALRSALETGDATAKDLTAGLCWQKMREELRGALTKKASAKLRANACVIFQVKKEILEGC